MEQLGLNTIRSMFLDFFESKGHYRKSSYSLIPQDDKSLLIINSGMAPLKPYFAGTKVPPKNRMTTCQKCIRTDDIENVGKTARHGTFFEMMGNFSFGDYFKTESIHWGWEFCTEHLKLPKEKLWVTVYLDDDEAFQIWNKQIGIPEERIVRLGKEDNFWEIGSGPCGPCSEIYYDRGEEYGCGKPDCKPGCDCDRYIEFWNHVFTQFDNDGYGNYTELAHKNIDTGMGLERMACIMQGVDSIFDVDTIRAVVDKIVELTGVEYKDGKAETDVSIRIITDHVRSATFMISDKIMPGNEGRGYVLRRLLRRASRHGRVLGMEDAFLAKVVDVVVDNSCEAYPDLETSREFIKKIVTSEEERFMRTLDQGMETLESFAEELKAEGKTELDGQKAFLLHDTYGFPIDITEEVMEEKGFTVDRDGFEEYMAQQKAAGKADAAKKDYGWADSPLEHLDMEDTVFTGYEQSEDHGKILVMFQESIDPEAKEGTQVQIDEVEDLEEGDIGILVLDKTPFYAKGGGQVSEPGTIEGDGFIAKVLSVDRYKNIIAHRVEIISGNVEKGMEADLKVDVVARNNSARNHTATHLLQKALRDTLGTHVEQAGSQVTPEGLRFDFTHFEALKERQIAEIEEVVNNKIDMFIPVTWEYKPLQEALDSGAMSLFEEKYGDVVRVVSIGDYSKELCGGEHVANTGQIGGFKILSEGGIASGVRRIEAITGHALMERVSADSKFKKQAAETLKTTQDGLMDRITALKADNSAMKKELEGLRKASLADTSGNLLSEAEEINGIKLIAKAFEGMSVDDLRGISDGLKAENDDLCLVLASVGEGKVSIIVSLTDDVISKGYHAGKMIKEIAKACGGGGGGKADMAQAGGKDPDKLEDAFAVARELLA